MVQRHDGGNCVKLTFQLRVLNTHRDQALVRRCGRIHSERVEAKLGQAVNQSAVATSDVQHARTCRDRRRKDSVEVLPPPRSSHTPETYQVAARERGAPGVPCLHVQAKEALLGFCAQMLEAQGWPLYLDPYAALMKGDR